MGFGERERCWKGSPSLWHGYFGREQGPRGLGPLVDGLDSVNGGLHFYADLEGLPRAGVP